MKKRLLFYVIKKQINHKNAIVITGMRQVGKTTLMKQLFAELKNRPKLFYDFDNPLDQKMFEDKNYNNIFYRIKQEAGSKKSNEIINVFIDEIQNYPEITKVIKYLIDHYKVKFFVTGSSNFYLKNLFPESLSGRKFLYHLTPLDFQEYLYFKNIIKAEKALSKDIEAAIATSDFFLAQKLSEHYQNYLYFGGFPEVVTTEDKETKKQILKNIFASFFEKDLKIISDYKDIRELRDLILLLVPRVGSMLDVSKIASELGVNRVKIYDYLEFLQGTFMIKLLPKFSQSIDRSVAGGRKVYFSDTGILNIIGNVNDAQLLENAVINQLSHYGRLSFFYKRNSAEIDAILNDKYAFEIKLAGADQDYKKLKKLAEKLKIPKAFIISKQKVEKPNFINAAAL